MWSIGKIFNQLHHHAPKNTVENVAPHSPALDSDMIPPEIWLEIFSYLTPEDIHATARVNKTFAELFQFICNDNSFWRNKFKKHFPHLLSNLKASTDINWYQRFRLAYENEYQGLSKKAKTSFSIIKEEDAVRAQLIIDEKTLNLYDNNKKGLISWVVIKKNQKILDHCFNFYFPSSEIDEDNQVLDDRLRFAILCHQPIETLDQIVNRGATVEPNIKNTPLMLAVKFNYVEAFKFLIAKGANPNNRELLHYAVDNIELLEIFINQPIFAMDYYSFLLTAAAQGKIKTLQYLLKNGFEVNESINGLTPLDFAIAGNYHEVIEFLLEKGANPDSVVQSKFHYSDHLEFEIGETPLHIAIKYRHEEIANKLLRNYALDVNAITTICNTPLILAAKFGLIGTVKTLLEQGAAVNRQNIYGATALLYAIANGNENIIDILLKAGADVTIATQRHDPSNNLVPIMTGDTPLHIAARSGVNNILQLILDQNPNFEAKNSKGEMATEVATKTHQSFAKLKVLTRLAKLNRLPEHALTGMFGIFGHTIKEEKEAGLALQNNLLTGAPKSTLDPYKNILEHSCFKAIYKGL